MKLATMILLFVTLGVISCADPVDEDTTGPDVAMSMVEEIQADIPYDFEEGEGEGEGEGESEGTCKAYRDEFCRLTSSCFLSCCAQGWCCWGHIAWPPTCAPQIKAE